MRKNVLPMPHPEELADQYYKRLLKLGFGAKPSKNDKNRAVADMDASLLDQFISAVPINRSISSAALRKKLSAKNMVWDEHTFEKIGHRCNVHLDQPCGPTLSPQLILSLL